MLLDSRMSSKEQILNVFKGLDKIWVPEPLIASFKPFLRLHLDHGDIICDEAYNVFLHQKLESVQCNITLAVTGAISRASWESFHYTLGLGSFESKRKYCKLYCFCKVFKTQSSMHLFDAIPTANIAHITRNDDKLFDVKSMQLLNRLSLPWEHKLEDKFYDTLNPIYNCGDDIEFFITAFFTTQSIKVQD